MSNIFNYISTIIPTLNRDEYLINTLNDLLNQHLEIRHELIIVDQNIKPVIERDYDLHNLIGDNMFVYLHIPLKGVVYARNKAIDKSKGQILVFIDDDVQIDDEHFLQKHLDNYQKNENIDAVCGREINLNAEKYSNQINYKRTEPLDDIFHFPRNYSKRIDATVFSTCNSSIKKNVLIKAGKFDKDFTGASYGDDADLALRLTNSGYRIVYDPVPALIHLMAGKGGLRLSDVNNKFGASDRTISRLVFYKKHIKNKSIKQKYYYLYRYVFRAFLFNRNTLNKPWKIPIYLFFILKNYFILIK